MRLITGVALFAGLVSVGYGITPDPVKATGDGGAPDSSSPSSGSSEGAPPDSHLFVPHAVFMTLGLGLLLPLGVVFMRVLRKPRWHFLTQILAVIFVLIGMSLGLSGSPSINGSKSYNSYHQIIGFVVVALILSQAALGVAAHMIFRKTGSKNAVGMSHRWFGYGTIVLGILSGFSGFVWADIKKYIVAYALSIVALAIILAVFILLRNRRNGKTGRSDTTRDLGAVDDDTTLRTIS